MDNATKSPKSPVFSCRQDIHEAFRAASLEGPARYLTMEAREHAYGLLMHLQASPATDELIVALRALCDKALKNLQARYDAEEKTFQEDLARVRANTAKE